MKFDLVFEADFVIKRMISQNLMPESKSIYFRSILNIIFYCMYILKD